MARKAGYEGNSCHRWKTWDNTKIKILIKYYFPYVEYIIYISCIEHENGIVS